jgi:hypothetical protein
VDDGSHPEPIEIELTSDDGPRDLVPPDGVLDEAGAPGGSPPDARRLVIVALVTGLVALALGWMLGRSGSESATPSEPVSTTTSSPPGTTVEVLPGEPIPAVDEDAPSGDAPERTPSTTTTPPLRVDLIDVNPALAGQGIELVGLNSANRLVHLDLDTGELVTESERRFGSEGLGPIVAGPDWVAVPNFNRPEMTLLRDGEEPEAVEVGNPWEHIRVPRTDRFWVAADADGSPFGAEFLEEISLLAGPTGRRVEVAGVYPVLADPAGALVSTNAGKVYLFDEEGASLLGAGELLTIGHDVALFRECDDTMRCYLAVLDRATGQLTELPNSEHVANRIPPTFWGYPPSLAPAVSSDGRFSVIVLLDDNEPVSAIIDLQTGVVAPLATPDFFPNVEWSDDGRFAFYTDATVPTAWDTESGEALVIAEELSGWHVLAVRSGTDPPADR